MCDVLFNECGQYVYKTTFMQYVCSMCTVCVRDLCGTCLTIVQYVHGVSTMSADYEIGMWPVLAWHVYGVCAIFFGSLHEV